MADVPKFLHGYNNIGMRAKLPRVGQGELIDQSNNNPSVSSTRIL